MKPVSAGQIRLPTDGYLAPTDMQRLLLGKTFDGKSENGRPQPQAVPPVGAAPSGAANAPAPGFTLN